MASLNQSERVDIKSISKINADDFTNSNITVQKITDDKDKKDKHKDDKVRIIWDQPTENLLSSWADIATCYNWMHDISFRKFQKKNFRFSLPVIILSTLTGTLNLALQGYVPQAYINYAQAGIGSVNIFTGILTTLQNYFRYAENSESHKNASIGWSKLQRNISIELSYKIKSRKDADTFVKVCRMEYDRLLEQSPVVPSDVIEIFKKDFIKDHDSKLITPDVCGQLKHTEAYKEMLIESDSQTEDLKIIPEIRDALLDRIVNLEKNLGIMSQAKSTQSDVAKSINEYTITELREALDRKNSLSEDNLFSNVSTKRIDSEIYMQNVVKKSLEPVIMGVKNENVVRHFPIKNSTRAADDLPANRPNIKDLISKFQTSGFPRRENDEVISLSDVKNEPVTEEKIDIQLNEKFNTPLKLVEMAESSLSKRKDRVEGEVVLPDEEQKLSGRKVSRSGSLSSSRKKSVSKAKSESDAERSAKRGREDVSASDVSDFNESEYVKNRISIAKTKTRVRRGNTREFVNDVRLDDGRSSDFLINIDDDKSLSKSRESKNVLEKSVSKTLPKKDVEVAIDIDENKREDSIKLIFVDTDEEGDEK